MDNLFAANDIEIQKTETVFQGFFRVLRYRLRHRLFSGEWSNVIQRELFARGDSVGVLLYDPARDCVALAQQFRIGCLDNTDGAWVWEVVAGMVKPDENSLQVALREVAEETGLQLHAEQLQPITRYFSSPGGTDERLQLYCALCDLPPEVEGTYGLTEEAEDIRIRLFATTTVFDAMLAGAINNAATIIALQWLHINRNRLQQQKNFSSP
ncbi:MAG TPA: NUDIX domain-containing protein [Pseudomonadales bacterium]|nr:NUDIX domain-containing protein [Pseudomonadales bacterium]